MTLHNSSAFIRDEFAFLLNHNRFTSFDGRAKETNTSTIELIGVSFLATDDSLFGSVDWNYVEREIKWYDSMSLRVDDIPGGAPTIWKLIASKKDGTINSNYGWCVYSGENNSQFNKVVAELKKNPESRRAVIIYTRPSIWYDYNHDGRSDFICTNAVQYLIRDGEVHACVQMRSNDAVFGYKNDRAWQMTMLARVAGELNLPTGTLHWSVVSLHVYPRHFYLVDHYSRTGEITITKARYRELYPNSLFNGTEA